MNTSNTFRTGACAKFISAAAAVFMTVATLGAINGLATRGASEDALLAHRGNLNLVSQLAVPAAQAAKHA